MNNNFPITYQSDKLGPYAARLLAAHSKPREHGKTKDLVRDRIIHLQHISK